MARVSIIVENPQLERVGLPIVTAASYDIQRELNAAGQWVVEFPAAEELADQVRSRWRISIVEEGRPGYLLRRGIVTVRQFNLQRAGQGLLRLAGFTRLYGVAAQSTHIGLHFDGTAGILDIAQDLTGEAVSAPTVPDVATRQPEVTFNDTSKLAALLGALEYSRLNIRETFDEDAFELVSRDDAPDSGFRFVTVNQAGPDLLRAAENGMGLISGSPQIGYDGRDLATRIIPTGVDHNGEPLTLEHATLSSPYPVLEGTNPDGSSFWYLEDEDAIAAQELIEAQYVRSDIKNPSDDAGTRQAAANAVYALGAGRLLATKSDVLQYAGEIANGRQVDALPGDRVQVQYRGRARSFLGGSSHWNLDRFMLVVKRRDASSVAGVRGVSFTLTAPEISLAIPDLPDAVPIPPPPRDPIDPPDPTYQDPGGDEFGAEADDDPDLEDLPVAEEPPPLQFPPAPVDPFGPTPHPKCCGDPTDGPGPGITPPPFDLGDGYPVPGCVIPFQVATNNDCRFVDLWGRFGANPGIGSADGTLNPRTDRAIVTLSSASAPPVLQVTGGTAQVLAEWDSPTPANFGGDGHHWWLLGYIIPSADTIDLAGTTGAFRNITWARAVAELTDGGGPFGQSAGAYGDGVEVTVNQQLEYHGSQVLQAIEMASADQSVRDGDFIWLWIDHAVRTIDDITIDKYFHAQEFNRDAHFFNAAPVPIHPGGGATSSIDWWHSGRVDSVTAGQRVQADFVVSFPNSVRCLSMAVSVRLRGLCAVGLIA